jgi:hypothetical protein
MRSSEHDCCKVSGLLHVSSHQTMKFFHATIALALLMTLLTACSTPSSPSQTPEAQNPVQASVSSQSSSSSEALSSSDAPTPLPPVVYKKGVCGADIPASWHVRSTLDQAAWNKEGNIPPPETITADVVFDRVVTWDAPLLKPAVFSMADADTLLPGHVTDPGAEDPNRDEIDVLAISSDELSKLMEQLRSTPPDYIWEILSVDGHEIRALRNTFSSGKYFGLQILFVPADVAHRDHGLIIINRSNDFDLQNTLFREGFQHFLSSMHFAECPSEW